MKRKLYIKNKGKIAYVGDFDSRQGEAIISIGEETNAAESKDVQFADSADVEEEVKKNVPYGGLYIPSNYPRTGTSLHALAEMLISTGGNRSDSEWSDILDEVYSYLTDESTKTRSVVIPLYGDDTGDFLEGYLYVSVTANDDLWGKFILDQSFSDSYNIESFYMSHGDAQHLVDGFVFLYSARNNVPWLYEDYFDGEEVDGDIFFEMSSASEISDPYGDFKTLPRNDGLLLQSISSNDTYSLADYILDTVDEDIEIKSFFGCGNYKSSDNGFYLSYVYGIVAYRDEEDKCRVMYVYYPSN